MDIQQLLAINLRKIRVSQKISQDDLALAAGIERAYVGYIERGKKNPTIGTVQKLANALGCSVKELFDDFDEHAEHPIQLRPGRKKAD